MRKNVKDNMKNMNFKVKTIERILKTIIGDANVSSGSSVINTHGQDCSYHVGQNPDLVAWPKNREQISEIAKLCSSHRFPIIPYGTGTGLEGGLSALNGGLCLNLQKLDQILDYNPEDFDVKVQPGITR